MKKILINLAVLFLSTLTWQCTEKSEAIQNGSLKSSLDNSIQQVKTAMNAITGNPGYQILTINDGMLKSTTGVASDSLYDNSILLENIAGVYDYHPVTIRKGFGSPYLNFFTKTAASSKMIVRLPEEKVKNPRLLFQFKAADSTLANNFVISVSEYQYKYKVRVGEYYKMASGIAVGSVDAGNLKIESVSDIKNGFDYTSEYTFSNGYIVKYQGVSGDTTMTSCSILKGSSVLFEEKLLTTKSGTSKFRDQEYILTIGDVQIKRTHGFDNAEVYVKGVLQVNSKIEIVDNTNIAEDATVCKKRDVKITFDDGTSATISELAGNTVTDIGNLFDSMKQVYFGKQVVDMIAFDLYTKKTVK